MFLTCLVSMLSVIGCSAKCGAQGGSGVTVPNATREQFSCAFTALYLLQPYTSWPQNSTLLLCTDAHWGSAAFAIPVGKMPKNWRGRFKGNDHWSGVTYTCTRGHPNIVLLRSVKSACNGAKPGLFPDYTLQQRLYGHCPH